VHRIIFVNRYFYPDASATSQLLTDLAWDLAGRGRDVLVITSTQTYENPHAALPPEAVVKGVRVTRIHTSRFGRRALLGRACDYATFACGAAWHLVRAVGRGDLVVAMTDPPLISIVAALIAPRRGAILINWVQDLFPEIAEVLDVRGLAVGKALLRRLRNASLRAARCNVVIGRRMARRLIGEGTCADTISLIPNWADGERIQPLDRDDNELRKQWGLTDKFVVGYSGNMGRAHDYATILEAAELLKPAEHIVFLFIGDGAQRPWIEREAERRGLCNVRFQPYQPQALLRLSLAAPDIHFVSLQPALEGLMVPSKFYGVAGAGRPTIFIGDPQGEIPAILREAGCGWTVAMGDASGAAALIDELSHSLGKVHEAGRKARRVFERHFDKRTALGRWRAVLDSA
jgi:glycosyltransferase involved in cell wall biosynthesis